MDKIRNLLEKFINTTTNSDLQSKKTNMPPISTPLKEYIDPNTFKPSKFAKVLAHIQLNLYKAIDPLDLIDYKNCPKLSHIATHNHNIFLLVKNSPDQKHFFLKVAQQSLKINNFNTFIVIYTALKNHLTKELNNYFEYDDPDFLRDQVYNSKGFVVPAFKIFYKDLEETSKSEVKSRNFCKSVEVYMRMQKMENLKVKEKWVDVVNKIVMDERCVGVEEDDQDTRFLRLL